MKSKKKIASKRKVYWAVAPQDQWDNRMDAVMVVFDTKKEANESHWMDWEVEGETGRSVPAYKIFPVHIIPLPRKPTNSKTL